jgi:hypothetical protein
MVCVGTTAGAVVAAGTVGAAAPQATSAAEAMSDAKKTVRDIDSIVCGSTSTCGECIFHASHAKPQRTRRDLNSVAEEASSGAGAKKLEKQIFLRVLRGFAASREKNLLSKSAPNCGCIPE